MVWVGGWQKYREVVKSDSETFHGTCQMVQIGLRGLFWIVPEMIRNAFFSHWYLVFKETQKFVKASSLSRTEGAACSIPNHLSGCAE